MEFLTTEFFSFSEKSRILRNFLFPFFRETVFAIIIAEGGKGYILYTDLEFAQLCCSWSLCPQLTGSGLALVPVMKHHYLGHSSTVLPYLLIMSFSHLNSSCSFPLRNWTLVFSPLTLCLHTLQGRGILFSLS